MAFHELNAVLRRPFGRSQGHVVLVTVRSRSRLGYGGAMGLYVAYRSEIKRWEGADLERERYWRDEGRSASQGLAREIQQAHSKPSSPHQADGCARNDRYELRETAMEDPLALYRTHHPNATDCLSMWSVQRAHRRRVRPAQASRAMPTSGRAAPEGTLLCELPPLTLQT